MSTCTLLHVPEGWVLTYWAVFLFFLFCRQICALQELRPDTTALVDWAYIVQKLCESRGGRPGLSVLTSLLVSVDVKLH